MTSFNEQSSSTNQKPPFIGSRREQVLNESPSMFSCKSDTRNLSNSCKSKTSKGCRRSFPSKKQELTNEMQAHDFHSRKSQEVNKRGENQFLSSTGQNFKGKMSCTDQIELDLQWQEKKSSLVYNFEDQTLNPARLRASDYRFNRQTSLPKAEEASVEMQHEIRKRESLKVFKDVVSKKT